MLVTSIVTRHVTVLDMLVSITIRLAATFHVIANVSSANDQLNVILYFCLIHVSIYIHF